MAGLYIHIPFCASRCIYCNFYSTTSLKLRQQYVDALCQEMDFRGESAKGDGSPISTIYLGGGTPSQLTTDQLRQLFLYINKVYMDHGDGSADPSSNDCDQQNRPHDPEITIEMNPDDVTADYAAVLTELGINRVSMGAQTFNDKRLRFLHRRHTAGQVSQAVKTLRDAGIHNISIDLMYGFPNETLDDWEHDIDAALALNVEHISAYCLSIEEGTPLYRMLHKGNERDCPNCEERSGLQGDCPLNEETERQMYELLIDKLTSAGYEHYEISNFAKPGFRSRHNSSYWQDIPYIGLGAAAHSYDLKSRSYNVADIHQYIKSIELGERPMEQEVIDANTHYNDRITVALRTSDGLDLATLSERHRRYCLKEAQKFIDDGLLRVVDNHLTLTRKGLFVSDYIMSSLIMV